jgi:hypothetical protein
MYGSRIPYLATFLDHGFLGWRAKKWASIALCPTNSTQSSAIYKLTGGLAGWMAQHCNSIVLCPPNNTQSSAIYKLTDRLQGWRAQDCDCLWMVILINYLTLSKNIIFNTKLLILNIDIVQFNYIKLLKDFKYSNTKLLILNIDIVQFNYIKLLKDVKSLILKDDINSITASITTTNLNFKGLVLI